MQGGDFLMFGFHHRHLFYELKTVQVRWLKLRKHMVNIKKH